MKTKKEVELLIPKWQLGILLTTSTVLLLTGIVFETYLADLSVWFVVSGFVLFVPAYVIIGADIASRNITHLWAMAMLTVPVAPLFVYLFMRDKINTVQPELV